MTEPRALLIRDKALGHNKVGQMKAQSIRPRSAALALALALTASTSSVVRVNAGKFPLPIPVRPTTFPLGRPAVIGTVVSWGGASVPANLGPVVAIAAGTGHTVALRDDGTVAAWLLDGSPQTNRPADLGKIAAIAAGGDSSLALTEDGTVVAWGPNDHSQNDVPPGLNRVVAIATGGYHSVALRDDGTVAVWGSIMRWIVSSGRPRPSV